MIPLYLKLIATLSVLVSLLHQHPTPSVAGGLPSIVPLDCSGGFTRPLYDTPSGNLDDGYYDPVNQIGSAINATTSLPNTKANVVGTQYFEVCLGSDKKQSIFPVTGQQMTRFMQNAASLPAQTESISL